MISAHNTSSCFRSVGEARILLASSNVMVEYIYAATPIRLCK